MSKNLPFAIEIWPMLRKRSELDERFSLLLINLNWQLKQVRLAKPKKKETANSVWSKQNKAFQENTSHF